MAWFTKTQKVAGGAGLSAAAAALAVVFIPHWESGSHMDKTVRHQAIDPPGVYTVCDGITNRDADFKWISPGMTFTAAQCAEMFKRALVKYVAPIVTYIPSYPSFPPHRQVALLSFAYNVGPGHIRGAIAREFNAGHVQVGCNLMGRYVMANGKALRGLQNRRFDPKWGEIAWCLRGD